MAWVPAAIGLVGDVVGGLMGSSSAHQANRTNLKNAREQRAWEEQMSNSAVQRRADDIEKAGFNRILAATGPGASTPSVSVPTANPTFDPNWTKGAGANAALLTAQLQNMRANTAATLAEARSKTVEADIREKLASMETDTRANRHVEQREWDNLRTQILRNENLSSAADAKRAHESADALIAIVKQQLQTGKYNLEAIRNAGEMSATTFGKLLPYIHAILGISSQGTSIYNSVRPGSSVEETVTNSTSKGGRTHTEITKMKRR